MKHCILAAVVCVACVCARAGTVPIVVDHYLPDARSAAPVRFGVPFARGVLGATDPVQIVDDRGEVRTSQTRPLATWNSDGSDGVRWLLVDFQADRERTYTLHYGNDAPQPTEATPIARIEDGRIVVDTGTLRGTIAMDKADLFGDLKSRQYPLAVGDAFSGMFVEHAERGLFRADLDPNPSVELEETGPVGAVIKLEGWYTNEAGEQFCRFKVRAHVFRGRSDIKLMHTFIFTGQSKEDKIASLGVQIPQRPGQRGYVAGDGGLLVPGIAMDFTSTGKYTIDSPNRDDIELLFHYPDGRRVRMAGRAAGYFSYSPFAAVVRDAWQQYPLGFNVTDGVARIELWPSGGRLLDTTFDGRWWFLDEHQKRFMLANKPKSPEDTDAWLQRFRDQVNATGVAKTHELWLTFPTSDAQNASGIPIRFGREVNFPVIAMADPAYMAATRALDYCAQTPRDDDRFSDEERYLDAMIPMIRELTDRKHWYGWWDWGWPA